MRALRRVFVFYEERSTWMSRQRIVSNVPGLEEMSYFLFGRDDIGRVVAEAESVLRNYGITLELCELEESSRLVASSKSERQGWLIWNITDGGGPFSGSHIPSFARLLGIKRFGNSSFNQFLSQDKFKCGLFCRQLGVPVPPALLCEGKTVVAGSLGDTKGLLFVKPCTLDNKIGIFSDACADDIESALIVSDRIWRLYGDRAVIQPFIRGRDIRVSFLNIDPTAHLRDAIGLYWSAERNENDSGFKSYQDHVAAFTAWDKESSSKTPIPADENVEASSDISSSLDHVTQDVVRIATGLGLRDYYSFDLRIDHYGRHWLMEVNTAPFLRNAGMRHFIWTKYGLPFGAAVAAAFQNSFRAAPLEGSLPFL